MLLLKLSLSYIIKHTSISVQFNYNTVGSCKIRLVEEFRGEERLTNKLDLCM